MTSTPFTPEVSDTDGHPDVAEVSALTEGLLSPERTAALRSHLERCALCADVRASLEEIREALGTLPGPVRMPADVAGRIDAALAAEALLDAEPGGRAGERVSRETTARPHPMVATDRAAGTALGTSSETTVTAAGDREPVEPVTAGRGHHDGDVSRETGTGTGTGTGSGGTARRPGERPAGRPRPRAATGPGRGGAPRRGRRWRASLLVGAGALAVLGVGGLVTQAFLSPEGGSGGSTRAHGSQQHHATGGSTASGRDEVADAALKKRVQKLLDTSGKSERSEAPAAPNTPQGTTDQAGPPPEQRAGGSTPGITQAPGNNPMIGSAETVPSCVAAGIHRTESPLAVDADADFGGGSGYLVLLPDSSGDPKRVDAYLVDPACVSSDRSRPGQVLLKRTFRRP